MSFSDATPSDFLRSILECPKGMVIFTLDRDYKYTSFSESHRISMNTLWGADIKLGMNMLEFLPNPDYKSKAKADFDKVLQGEHFTSVESHEDHRTPLFYENRYAPVSNGLGNIIGLSVFVINITELKQTEIALNLSQQRLKSVLNTIPDLIFKINSKGTYLEFILGETSGHDAANFTGKNINDILSPQIASLYSHAIKRSLQHQIIRTIDYKVTENGSLYYYETRFIPFSQDEVLAVVRDITPQKKTENELLKLSLIAENTSNAVVITDADGRVEWVNEAFTRITEYTLAEVIGKKPGPILQGEESDPEVCEFMRTKVLAKEPFMVELVNYTKSGKKYWMHINAQPIFENSGQVTKFFAIETDITERKIAEIKIIEQNTRLTAITENLTRKNEQLEEFTQIVSHNLRSPIGNISALLEHIQATQDDNDRKEILNHLKISTKSIMLTLHELNEVLKIKYAGHITREAIKFQDIYDKVKGMLLLQINDIEAKVTADFELAPTIFYPTIYIESIILNLLSNALKYFSPERQQMISFKTWVEHANIMMSVSDTGAGIDLERYGHQIFKLRKTFHPHPESRGVGLFLIKNQIETMGGEIDVKSDLNTGTTFTINFGTNSYAR